MPHTISFINYKGGVGKTTTAYHIGCALAEHSEEFQVLLVDIDPQMNCTFLCTTADRWEEKKRDGLTLFRLFDRFLKGKNCEYDLIWENPIQKSGKTIVENLELIPGDSDLLRTDMRLGRWVHHLRTSEPRDLAEKHLEMQTILDGYIADVKEYYDFILFDCPPNLYYLTQNALAASEWYIIPTIPDYLSTIGLTLLRSLVTELKDEFSRNIAACSETHHSTFAKLKAILFCRARKWAREEFLLLHQSQINLVKSQFTDIHIFESYTTESIRFAESASEALPIWHSINSKNKNVGEQYKHITDELLSILEEG